ncbi:MAG TPA: carbohydrate-binding family 9-like protein [Gemmataceae bacterium]|nr:carbohydrate-binding family 9-like protein [Gemmataceae bacterium]
MTSRRLLALLPAVLLLIAGLALFRPADRVSIAADAPPTAFECRWADRPITLDGKADEEAWKHAQVIDQFYLPWLGRKARKARTATKARLLWDREYLYFFADLEDADLYADIKEHDGMIWENDVFELFFKPADDKPGYYEFQVNPAGAVLDMFLPRRGAGGYRRFKGDGEFHVEAKVHLRGTLNRWQDRDEGWSVEGRIPWKDFLRTGGRPQPGESWKFALCRYDYSVDFEGPELSTCAPLRSLDRPDFHHYEDYASLKFVGPTKEGAARPFGIDKRVLLTRCKVVGFPDPPPPYRVQRAYPNLKLDYPIAVRHQPGSDRLLFITQRDSSGRTDICRMKDEPGARDFETLLKLDGVAYDLTFHPQFAKNGYVFIGWNGPSSGKSADKRTKVTRYTMSRTPPYALDPKSEKLIIEWPSDGMTRRPT